MRYTKKISTIIFILIFALNFSPLFHANAADTTIWTEVDKQMSKTAVKSGYSATAETEAPPAIEEVVAKLIEYVLSFLGVIFIILIIYAGFLWMTASGDSDKITKAKGILINAIIGVIIILSAYIITAFVLSRLGGATGTG